MNHHQALLSLIIGLTIIHWLIIMNHYQPWLFIINYCLLTNVNLHWCSIGGWQGRIWCKWENRGWSSTIAMGQWWLMTFNDGWGDAGDGWWTVSGGWLLLMVVDYIVDYIWLMLVAYGWWWLMTVDDGWCWVMITDDYWWWLMLADDGWLWLTMAGVCWCGWLLWLILITNSLNVVKQD